MAQVALLQTEMNSGFRFVPRIGMNSAARHTRKNVIITLDEKKKTRMIGTLCMYCMCVYASEIITNTWFDMREAGLGQVTQ